MRSVPWYKHITGVDGSTYRREYRLTPLTRWGHLRLFVYERGDGDPDPHDHPWDFWTFPLADYVEAVMGPDGKLEPGVVGRFRWHRRPAEYVHMVLGRRPLGVPRRFVTLVWVAGPPRRDWGFWVPDRFIAGKPCSRTWVHWRAYMGMRKGRADG